MEIDEIYREYKSKVLAYIRGKIGNAEDAEDLCSDVFLKVQKKLPEYDQSKASVSTWIYTITRNAVIDFYRVNKITEELPEELAMADDTDSELLRQETLSELADALNVLSDEERKVIVLHYYEKLSLREIELKTGLSYGQVKLRHNSALKTLRNFLDRSAATGGSRIVSISRRR